MRAPRLRTSLFADRPWRDVFFRNRQGPPITEKTRRAGGPAPRATSTLVASMSEPWDRRIRATRSGMDVEPHRAPAMNQQVYCARRSVFITAQSGRQMRENANTRFAGIRQRDVSGRISHRIGDGARLPAKAKGARRWTCARLTIETRVLECVT